MSSYLLLIPTSDIRNMNNTVLSFFAGAGGLDTGFKKAGFVMPWANEYDKQIVPTLQANHNQTVVDSRSLFDIPLEDIPDNPDGIIGGPPCFPSGSYVLTQDSYKDISKIQPGDMVMTHSGRFREVLEIGGETAEVIKVKIFGSPAITTTPGHPFYVVERKKSSSSNREERYSFSHPFWLEAAKLTKEHFVVSPLDTLGEESKLSLTDKEAYFIGRWVGDGWLRKTPRAGTYSKTLKSGKKIYRKSGYKKAILVCCSIEEQDNLRELFAEIFDTFHESHKNNLLKFSGYSIRMFEILEQFGKGAEGKNFPSWVFSEPLNIQRNMLRGYLDSDGSYNKGIYNITTVSERLALGIQRLVRNVFKINPGINKFIRPRTTIIEGRVVNQKDTYQIRWYDAGNKTTSVFHEGMLLSKVFGIENVGSKMQVFNFSVLEDESYTINNFAVHNCQTWSAAGLGKGLAEPRGQVFLNYLKVVETKKPKFFLAENVKGMLAKSRENDLKTVLAAMNSIGYKIAYKLFNVHDYGVPQDRWRVIFVGYRDDLNISPTFPEPSNNLLTLKDSIWDLRLTGKPSLQFDHANKKLAVANHEYSTGTFSSQYMSRNRVRLWNEASFTIQASGRQAPLHPDSGLMVKVAPEEYTFAGDKTRRLTVRECARIQTFPDDYVFLYKNVNLGYKMIGNAVPVVFAEKLALHIKQELNL